MPGCCLGALVLFLGPRLVLFGAWLVLGLLGVFFVIKPNRWTFWLLRRGSILIMFAAYGLLLYHSWELSGLELKTLWASL